MESIFACMVYNIKTYNIYIHTSQILRISLLSAADLLFGCPFGMLSNLYRASENNVRNNNENIKKLIKKEQ